MPSSVPQESDQHSHFSHSSELWQFNSPTEAALSSPANPLAPPALSTQSSTAMRSQQAVIDSLPQHLQAFVAYQHYQRYTPQDQAVWRFLLQQLRSNLSSSAHPVYLQGLRQTGISMEYIPRIEQINCCLSLLGWRAVAVDGFLPPAIFMEFQACKVLAIAVEIRSIEHMLYTPAPDIVHESAGHAPFLVDVEYQQYLQRFGELGMQAIASQQDLVMYEATRQLSLIKENTASSIVDIQRAEHSLKILGDQAGSPSEAALIARLHWWTVEYGLVGELHHYHLFGAGLLSSLGESVNCLDDHQVKKIPLTIAALNQSYDISREQQQLFVAKNCRHLSQVLEQFGRQMSACGGGARAVATAIAAQTVNTAVADAGVAVSGVFSRIICDALDNISYVETQGPTQLSYQKIQLPGHGINQHASGLGFPVGELQGAAWLLSVCTLEQLSELGIREGAQASLQFVSGLTVTGLLVEIVRREQKNLLLRFQACVVTAADGEILVDTGEGCYDMVVAGSISSVYGGSADPQHFPLYSVASAQKALTSNEVKSPPIDSEGNSDNQNLLRCYQSIRLYRELGREMGLVKAEQHGANHALLSLSELITQVDSLVIKEWLLVFELIELLIQYDYQRAVIGRLMADLGNMAERGDDDQAKLIGYGFARLQDMLQEAS